ncbi:MAG: chromate transporter [Elusimicrobiaceae bacterium]|nr:chromate transporter [Elusimicrobiaceae bacterium]
MKVLFSLFFVFAKIGLFTLGGGYAMVPLMERELCGKYLTKEDFLDALALAQAAPGIMAINTAILTGYKIRGVWGSVFASLGAALPSFIIILILAVFFKTYQQNPIVRRIFIGVRPAVIALILVPVFNLARTANITWKTVWIPIVVVLAVWAMGISPVYLVILAGLGGYLYGRVAGAEK